MKKNSILKGFFIAAIFCAVIFSACKQAPDPQKKIVVTGIPSQYNGNVGAPTLLSSSNGDIIALGAANISGGTVTADLFEYGNTSVPFTGSGTYIFALYIINSNNAVVWMGGVTKSITNETTTISFSELMPVSSVQQTPFSFKDVLQGILKQYE